MKMKAISTGHKNKKFNRERIELDGQALQIAKTLENFIGGKPLKVLA